MPDPIPSTTADSCLVELSSLDAERAAAILEQGILSAIVKCIDKQGKSSQSLEFKKRLDLNQSTPD